MGKEGGGSYQRSGQRRLEGRRRREERWEGGGGHGNHSIQEEFLRHAATCICPWSIHVGHFFPLLVDQVKSLH